jgi:WD40-like Beta Propeller Repeat
MENLSRRLFPAILSLFALAVVSLSSYDPTVTWSVPEDLGSVVNTALADNRSPQISADGRTLYFGSTRARGFGGLDVYVSHRANPNAPWETPVNVGSNINGSANDSNPYGTEDGHYLFFNSNRTGGCGGNDLYVSHRADPEDDTGWEPPTNLGCTVNSSASDSGPVVIRDPATGLHLLFFASGRAGGLGSNDFYVSMQAEDGTFGAGTLIPEISSAFDDNKLTVHPDGLDVFFSSDRPGGGSGAAGFNIWTAHRNSVADAWSTPTLALESAGLPSLTVNRKSLYVVIQQPGSNMNGVPFLNDVAVSHVVH